jgi:DNA-binding GntR family transcriptional regulator
MSDVDGRCDNVTSLLVDRPWPRLRERVVEVLRAAIRRGQFAPGERLTERKLGELVGVSRTVIREALRQLEADGLIDNIPYRGPTVAVYSRDQVIEIYDVRNALESHAAQLFAERATDAELKALKAVFAEIERLVGDEGERYLALIDRFYEVLLAGAHNHLLEAMNESIRERARLMRNSATRHALHLADTIAEKGAIVAAIAARDPERARAASARHIAAALQRVLPTLAPAAGGSADRSRKRVAS